MYYISINKIHNTIRNYNDLYVEIQYNNKKRRTTTVWNQELPVWNEKFIFDLVDNVNNFKITIYEKNIWSSTEKLYENKIKINKDNIKTFKYRYLEISHGKLYHNEINSIKEKYEKLINENKMKQEENNYLNEKVETLKIKLITKENDYNKIKQATKYFKANMEKIKNICDYNFETY